MADEPAPDAAAEATDDPADAPNPDHDTMLATLRDRLGADAVVETATAYGDLIVRVAPDRWLDAATVAANDLGVRLPLVHRRPRLGARSA